MMSTQSRKQREIAQRERLILDVARGLLVDHGYLGLNMDRVAEATEYAKGTIYNHFGSKEDLVGALVAETMAARAAMFHRAVAFDGRPRERITGVGLADQLFAAVHGDHFRTEQILDVGSIYQKISDARRDQIARIKSGMMDGLTSVVRDAIEADDLVLRDEIPECNVLYGLWSMSVGHHQLLSCEGQMPHFEGADLTAALWNNYQMLLDGYDWKPLSTEWDYTSTIERLQNEVFSDESAAAQHATA